MRCSSEKNLICRGGKGVRSAFTLPEVMGALLILAIILSGIFVIIDRCVNASVDMEIQMQAFEIAQQNMEKILCTRPVTEAVEYGFSDINPAIQWQTATEVINDMGGEHMWVKATSTAEYRDSADEIKKIEFVHWVSQLTDAQVKQLMDQGQTLEGQLIATIEDAASYCGVDVETIKQWESSGMLKEGQYYIKLALDCYKNAGGNPSPETIQLMKNEYEKIKNKPMTDQDNPTDPTQNPTTDPLQNPDPTTDL